VDETELAERRVGSVFQGTWTLERLLGVGGMAAVYVGRHKSGRLDAIKILHPELARSEMIRARFEQEAHVLRGFKHPGAVEVRDLETSEDDAPFMVMELLDGRPLAAVIRDGVPPSVDDTLRMADDVLDVLAAAHARGIIHRDIKPDNLFVLQSGAIKVLDFGIAQVRGAHGQAPLKTKTGTTLGTVAYMPPEQLKGLDIDVRADVYGVGATMFRMLAGRTPHDAPSDVELMMQVLTEPAPRIASVTKSVREDVAQIVDRSLSFDRDARYPDARSMQDAVRAARTAPNPKLVEPLRPSDDVKTITPMVEGSSEGGTRAPTIAAAPDAALLDAATPEAPTRAVAIATPTRKSEMPGLVLVAAAGLALVVLAGLAVATAVVVAVRRHEPPPAASVSVAAPPAPHSLDDSDEPPEPKHGHGPPHPHGKHKP
jgi:serine/threonine protein kinase